MLKGICTPVCTPFTKSNNTIDEGAYLAHIDRMIENKVDIICVAGGTGEFSFLSKEERLHMAEIVAKHIEGRAKLIVHTSAIRTEETIEYSKHAEGLGADAIMVLPPYFEGPQDDGVFMHFEKLSNAVKTPIMLYNIPVHSGYDITPSIFLRLSQLPTVQYIKDSTGDFKRAEDLIAVGAKLFCGCDYLAPHALLAGATGCFWGGSNFMSKQAVQIYSLYKENKLTEMFELWEKMKAANIFLWNSTSYNSAIKGALTILGNDLGPCREPVLPLSTEETQDLLKVLRPLMS